MDKLLEMTQKSPTGYWNDSCSVKELTYAIERGATGGTSNPVIVKTVLQNNFEEYKDYIDALIKEHATANEDEIAWMVIEKLTIDGAKQLEKVFDPVEGTGRMSIQTNPKNFRNAEKIVEQAVYFSKLAKNIQVKIPVTAAGVKAIEEATYRGVCINATVSYTVAQDLAVCEAVERGFKRREAEGLSNAELTPVSTLMIGRMDDWLKLCADRDKIIIDPEAFEYAGVAVMKKAYRIHQERGYKTKILGAAYRNHHHWSAFIGGDILVTIPYAWQQLFNASDVEVKNRIDDEIPETYLKQLRKFPDFVKGYEENGLTTEEFQSYGMLNFNLRQFLAGYDELVLMIRNQMVKY
jgi:transaldolase